MKPANDSSIPGRAGKVSNESTRPLKPKTRSTSKTENHAFQGLGRGCKEGNQFRHGGKAPAGGETWQKNANLGKWSPLEPTFPPGKKERTT